MGKMLQDIDAVYFEEPCPFDHLEDTKRVTEALTIPVAGGEQEGSQRRFRWMIANRGVDIVQPDLHYYGGLIRSTIRRSDGGRRRHADHRPHLRWLWVRVYAALLRLHA